MSSSAAGGLAGCAEPAQVQRERYRLLGGLAPLLDEAAQLLHRFEHRHGTRAYTGVILRIGGVHLGDSQAADPPRAAVEQSRMVSRTLRTFISL